MSFIYVHLTYFEVPRQKIKAGFDPPLFLLPSKEAKDLIDPHLGQAAKHHHREDGDESSNENHSTIDMELDIGEQQMRQEYRDQCIQCTADHPEDESADIVDGLCDKAVSVLLVQFLLRVLTSLGLNDDAFHS